MKLHELAALEALRIQLHSLEDTIDDLRRLTLSAPGEQAWDQARDSVGCLDAIAVALRHALDSMSDVSDAPKDIADYKLDRIG